MFTGARMRQIRARIQHRHHIHIHDDLASAAFFYRYKLIANGEVKGC